MYMITKLTDVQRDELLSAALQRAADAEKRIKSVLTQVRDWNPEIAEQFDIKSTLFSMAPLRMMQSDWEMVSKTERSPNSSFVALSYSWRTP